MTRVHFVFPHRERVSTPDAIGWKVGERLRERGYDVVHHDWDELDVIEPGPDDVLLGHPHPMPGTIFRRSAKRRGWKRVIALKPYCHGDIRHDAFFDRVIGDCDLFLAITGNYWFSTVGQSVYSHWRPKMAHLDLAADRRDFPPLKEGFNEPGRRRFVYIGSMYWYKNTRYLTEIARAMPEAEIAWIGSKLTGLPGLNPLGYQNFDTEEGKRKISEYDYMITVGDSDANPSTILMAMGWGLVPVCTPESGYHGYPSIPNVPLNDVEGAVDALRRLQHVPEEDLRGFQSENWRLLDEHFDWDRFVGQVVEAIESDASPALGRAPSSGRRALIRWAELQYATVYNVHLKGLVKNLIRKRVESHSR